MTMFYLVGVVVLDNKVNIFIKDDSDNTIDKVTKSDLKFALYNGVTIEGVSFDKNTQNIDFKETYFDKNIYILKDKEFDALDKIITGSKLNLGIKQDNWDKIQDLDDGTIMPLSEGLSLICDACVNDLDSYGLSKEEKVAIKALNQRYSLTIGSNVEKKTDTLENNVVLNLDEYSLEMDTPPSDSEQEMTLENNIELGCDHNHDDTDEEDDEEVSTVSALYKQLTEDQLAVLRRYYLWYSQRVIEIAGGKGHNTALHANTKQMKAKRDALNKLKKTGGTWAYAGFIDTGRHGGDHCAFGHALRYLHIAWDVEKSDIEEAFFGIRYNKRVEQVLEDEGNNAIKFGIKCVGDFFDVDPSYKKFLMATQRETLKDMGTLYNYYSDGRQNDVNSSFTVMDNLIKYVQQSTARNVLLGRPTVIDAGTTQFYLQCRETGLVPPKSLVQLVRDSIIGWHTHKFTKMLGKIDVDFFIPVINGIFNGKFNNLISMIYDKPSKYTTQYSLKRALKCYIDTYFMYKVCGEYEYTATKESKDEGGASEPVRRELNDKYRTISRMLWSDIEYSVEYLTKIDTLFNLLSMFDKKEFESVYTFNVNNNFYSINEDTKKVDLNLVSSYSTEKDSSFGNDFTLLYNITNDYIYSYNSNTRQIFAGPIDIAIDKLKKAIDSVTNEKDSYIEWTRERVQKVCDERNEFYKKEREKKELEEKLKAEQEKATQQEKQNEIDEIKKKSAARLSMKELITVLINEDLSSLPVTFNKHKMILDTVKNYTNISKVSRAQRYNLEQLYNYITGKEETVEVSVKTNLDDRKDLEDALKWALDNKQEVLSEEGITEFNLRVANSVIYRRTISEKQLPYLEALLKVYQDKVVTND